MGVRTKPVLYVGKSFNDTEEALEFVKEHLELTEDDLLEIEVDGLHEWMYEHDVLSFKLLNYYVSNPSCVLGIDILRYVLEPATFNDEVMSAVEQWEHYFGEEPYNIICDVRVS